MIDVDATLITDHSEKDGASGTFERGFGSDPLLAYLDETREALAGMLRPGNLGPTPTPITPRRGDRRAGALARLVVLADRRAPCRFGQAKDRRADALSEIRAEILVERALSLMRRRTSKTHAAREPLGDLRRQLGHDARLTLGTYGHVIDALDGAPRIAAEDAIRAARDTGCVFGVSGTERASTWREGLRT